MSAGESGETDIFLHDIARGANLPVFSSPAVSEYSPKGAPDGLHISYVQENEAGDVTRVHWRLADGSDEGEAVADFAPLGYYAWIDGGAELVVYYRSEPGSLYRVDVASGATTELYEKNVGRTLVADKAGAVVWFTQAPPLDPNAGEDAPPAGPFKVMQYAAASGAIAPLFDLPGAAQDLGVVFGDDGAASGYFSADGTTLYYRAAAGNAWAPVAELAGIAKPTRVAVSDDKKWVAIVGEKPAE